MKTELDNNSKRIAEQLPQKDIDYLSHPTIELLEEYGGGRHIPGSGSAAALSGLIGLELLKTVCKLTIRRPQYQKFHEQMKFILQRLEFEYKPRLIKLFNEDIKTFDTVSKLRKARDGAPNEKEKERLNREALDVQKEATYIPLNISKTCLEIIQFAITIFDKGFKSARGDSGVAISNLLAAISGALFVVFLNLKSYKESKWLREITTEADVVLLKYDAIHKEAFKRVMNLYTESLDTNQLQLFSTGINE